MNDKKKLGAFVIFNSYDGAGREIFWEQICLFNFNV